jgi:hypothetical protein
MKAKKTMRWVLVLSFTGACAVAAVLTLDAWTRGDGANGLAAKTPFLQGLRVPGSPAPATPTPAPADAPEIPAGDPVAVAGSADGNTGANPVNGAGTATAAGDAGLLLPSASPFPAEKDRLLEQIETARAGLLVAQSSVPARVTGRAAWMPVILFAGGGGLIGCALGLGVASFLGRKRGGSRSGSPVGASSTAGAGATATTTTPTPATPKTPAAGSPARPVPAGLDEPADEVVRAARAELANRVAWSRPGSPAVSAAPVPAARAQAISNLEAAAAVIRPHDPEDDFPAPRPAADPVDRRISALERSLLQVVRAMEEVADRVPGREAATATPTVVPAPSAALDLDAEVPFARRAGQHAPRRYADDGDDLERDEAAPPMRAPRRRERSVASRAAASPTPQARGTITPIHAPAPPPSRPAPALGRAVRALRAVREEAPSAPAPWDLAPAAPVRVVPAAAERRDPSLPSASTVDGRDLVRIRRAVLRLAAEGWDGGRIADKLRLGEGDVALIMKTSGAETRREAVGGMR